jgi:flagellar hook-length control protein FliK
VTQPVEPSARLAENSAAIARRRKKGELSAEPQSVSAFAAALNIAQGQGALSPTQRARAELATGQRQGPSAAAETKAAIETQAMQGTRNTEPSRRPSQPDHPQGRGSMPQVKSPYVAQTAPVSTVHGSASIDASTNSTVKATGRNEPTMRNVSSKSPAIAASATGSLRSATAQGSAERAGGAARVSANQGSASARAGSASGITIAASSARASRAHAQAKESLTPTPEEQQALTQQVESSFATLLSRRGGKVTLHLKPESLGEITIRMKIRDGAIDARFETSGDSARDAIAMGIEGLRASLEERGLVVSTLEVRSREVSASRKATESAAVAAAGSSGLVRGLTVAKFSASHSAMRKRDAEHLIVAEDPRLARTVERGRGSPGRVDTIDLVA